MTLRKPDKVVPLFRRRSEDIEEIPLGRSLRPKVETPAEGIAPVLDLSSRPKVFLGIGRGASGKTTLLRWLAERALNAGRQVLFAAVDPEERELAGFFKDVYEPEGHSPLAVSKWLKSFLGYALEEKMSAAIDLGGGDTTLPSLVAGMPGLVATMEAEGVAPVAAYLLSPRTSDLSPLSTLQQNGFEPPATLLIRNEGRVPIGTPREEAFSATMSHSAYRRAVEHGGVEVWMPALDPEVAKTIEDRRLQFGAARDGQAKQGSKAYPLGPFERAAVTAWLEQMDAAFAPVTSWLP
jgi:hypothetical protein